MQRHGAEFLVFYYRVNISIFMRPILLFTIVIFVEALSIKVGNSFTISLKNICKNTKQSSKMHLLNKTRVLRISKKIALL